MGHPTKTSEEIKARNDAICQRLVKEPSLTKADLAREFGLNRETIRGIVFRHQRTIERNARVAEKFKGVFKP
jgi:DeoR/GlpR family transcriptional regulator of sugar metabolism